MTTPIFSGNPYLWVQTSVPTYEAIAKVVMTLVDARIAPLETGPLSPEDEASAGIWLTFAADTPCSDALDTVLALPIVTDAHWDTPPDNGDEGLATLVEQSEDPHYLAGDDDPWHVTDEWPGHVVYEDAKEAERRAAVVDPRCYRCDTRIPAGDHDCYACRV